MAENVSEDAHDYSLLKDLRLQIGVEDSSFFLCFWVYLMNSTPFPATIIGQVLNYPVSCFLGCFSIFLSISLLCTMPVYPLLFWCSWGFGVLVVGVLGMVVGSSFVGWLWKLGQVSVFLRFHSVSEVHWVCNYLC